MPRLTLCPTCRTPLDPGAACARPACVTRAGVEQAQRVAREVRQRAEAAYALMQRRSEPLIRAAAQRMGETDADRIAHVVTPHITLNPEPRPETVTQAFVAHLDRILDLAFPAEDRDPATPPDFSDRRADLPPDPMALTAACIACRGRCCMLGLPNHAFLTEDTLAYYRHTHPEVTRGAAREDYLARMPDLSVTRSCVYHGVQGCTLPREMRSDLCNGYQCFWRKRLIGELEQKGSDRSIVVGLVEDHTDFPDAGGPAISVVTVAEGDRVSVHDDLCAPSLLPIPGG